MNRYFIITIDTEGDNLWSVSDLKTPIRTENAKFLQRFQELCEKYGFIPTYLTNYEMANADAMRELGRVGLKKGTLEIGSHEHAWNSPPYFPLIKSPIKRGKPYLGEYPQLVIRKKLEYLTKLLEDTFQCPITSHRGGRWCLNAIIIRELDRLGYTVDCTCTPGISWKRDRGWSIGSRGTDWSSYENRPFILDYPLGNGRKKSGIIEIPVTSVKKVKGGTPKWFRPDGSNLMELLGILDYMYERREPYIEFMLHSSELMPGGSPTFVRRGQIEKLYGDLDMLFSRLKQYGFCGIGLSEYAKKCKEEKWYE